MIEYDFAVEYTFIKNNIYEITMSGYQASKINELVSISTTLQIKLMNNFSWVTIFPHFRECESTRDNYVLP